MFCGNANTQTGKDATALMPPVEPPSGLQAVFSRQPVEKFDAGTAIFWERDPAKHVFEVVEGVLRIFKMLSDGRRVITGFLYPGDLIGISLQDRYLYSAEAVTPTKLRRFARNRFQEEIAHSPELRPQLLAHLCDEMAAAQDQMLLLARKNAEERVCSFLVNMVSRMRCQNDPQPLIEIPMTRLDMADYLGLTIETVSRTMTKLTSRGIITPSGRHNLVIRDLHELAALAGETEDDENGAAGFAMVNEPVWSH